jgi:hypothetical protein
MTPSGPLYNRLPPFAAFFFFLFAANLAYSQAPPKYDPATETTVKGTVLELRIVPPTGPKPFAYLATQVGPDKGKDVVQIFLCPKKFLDDVGLTFKTDDAIQVTGSKVKQDGADLILAREVIKGEEKWTFRFQDGKPAW